VTVDVKILADSINSSGARLVTWELEYPKWIHPQVMTHRQFSRNAQSSRAIPTNKLIENIRNNPAIPSKWGTNKQGMEAKAYVEDPSLISSLNAEWISGLDYAVETINRLESLLDEKLHKQIVNRLLEPWAHIKVILSSTFHQNFFHLRCAHDAQPEIQELAIKMRELYKQSIPIEMHIGDWHLPLIRDDEKHIDLEDLRNISAGRCARVSYLTHDGVRDVDKDIELGKRLVNDGHFSPLEHVATPIYEGLDMCGNFRGWMQYRKMFHNECEREPVVA
jgi:thymidylate synthase ThyX